MADFFVSFECWTEPFSIFIYRGRCQEYGDSCVHRELTQNKFWSSKVGIPISNICILVFEHPGQEPLGFGLEIEFLNGEKTIIENVDDNIVVSTQQTVAASDSHFKYSVLISNKHFYAP